VPGISSAVAAPALFGIPVTHRGTSSSFVVVSGHAPPGWVPVLSSLAPGSATVVVLMGLAARGAIAARLVARGWPEATPAAVLLAAGTPDAHAWTGPLSGLEHATLPDPDAPGTIVVGAVVALASSIAPAPAAGRPAAHGGS
jgi:siroheme synthase